MVKKKKTLLFFFFKKDTCSHNKVSDLIYDDIFKCDSKFQGRAEEITLQCKESKV